MKQNFTRPEGYVPVLITTEYAGATFFGHIKEGAVPEGPDRTLYDIKNMSCLIRWRSGKGFIYAATDGLTEDCLVSVFGECSFLPKVTGIFPVTEKAEQSWCSK